MMASTGLTVSGPLRATAPTTCSPDRIQKGQGTRCPSMGLRHPATFAQNSDLRPTRKAWGADCDAACAKRDERQFSKAAQTRNCPKPRRDRAKSSKKKKTEVVANKNDV